MTCAEFLACLCGGTGSGSGSGGGSGSGSGSGPGPGLSCECFPPPGDCAIAVVIEVLTYTDDPVTPEPALAAAFAAATDGKFIMVGSTGPGCDCRVYCEGGDCCLGSTLIDAWVALVPGYLPGTNNRFYGYGSKDGAICDGSDAGISATPRFLFGITSGASDAYFMIPGHYQYAVPGPGIELIPGSDEPEVISYTCDPTLEIVHEQNVSFQRSGTLGTPLIFNGRLRFTAVG